MWHMGVLLFFFNKTLTIPLSMPSERLFTPPWCRNALGQLWGSSLCLLICQMEEERYLSCVAPEGRIGTKGQMWWGGWLDSPSHKGFGAVQPVANSLTRQWVVAFPWAHFNGGPLNRMLERGRIQGQSTRPGG